MLGAGAAREAEMLSRLSCGACTSERLSCTTGTYATRTGWDAIAQNPGDDDDDDDDGSYAPLAKTLARAFTLLTKYTIKFSS